MITVTGTRENYIAEMTADRGTLNATHCDIPVEQGGQNAYMRPGETLDVYKRQVWDMDSVRREMADYANGTKQKYT